MSRPAAGGACPPAERPESGGDLQPACRERAEEGPLVGRRSGRAASEAVAPRRGARRAGASGRGRRGAFSAHPRRTQQPSGKSREGLIIPEGNAGTPLGLRALCSVLSPDGGVLPCDYAGFKYKKRSNQTPALHIKPPPRNGTSPPQACLACGTSARDAASGGGRRRHGDGRDARPGGWPSRHRQQGEAHAEVVRSAACRAKRRVAEKCLTRARREVEGRRPIVCTLSVSALALLVAVGLYSHYCPCWVSPSAQRVACRCASPAPYPSPHPHPHRRPRPSSKGGLAFASNPRPHRQMPTSALLALVLPARQR